MVQTHYPPMHRMLARLPTLKTVEIKSVIETLISSVTAQADLYACLLFLENLSRQSNAQHVFSTTIVSLSNNFPEGIFTSTSTIDELIAKIQSGEFIPEARNRIIVSFASIFEAAVLSAMGHFGIQNPTSKYRDIEGHEYETKIINMWLKLYHETIGRWAPEDYFTPAVSRHAVGYWSKLYKARNVIVHAGGIAKQDQVAVNGDPWGVTAVGQVIKTRHNKIDDVIQFFDNSFGRFLCDLDRYP